MEGSTKAINTAMITITTSNSIKVNAFVVSLREKIFIVSGYRNAIGRQPGVAQ